MASILAAIARHAVLLLAVGFLVAGSAIAASNLIDGGDVKNGSLTGKDIKDGSLNFSDFKGGAERLKGERGPTGPTGPQGPSPRIDPDPPISKPGPTGPTGPSGEIETEVVNGNIPPSIVAEKELTVECKNGPVLGGGYVVFPNSSPVRVVRSYAVAADKWLVRAVSSDSSSWELTVVAICSK